ncbi:hypothetical protein ACFYVL_40320 [Streptomyces sp. NPDC004111]|uniref:hypothetical protein n=1 Tax=Streptomyces sp. NPDC004111 TaxID=3364690 RepID=UPI0036C67732
MGFKKSAAILGGTLLLATTATVGTVAAAPASAPSCAGPHALRSSQGHASIFFCGTSSIFGTVYDDKADGKCPLVIVYLKNGGKRYSNWAGPKGDSSPVNVSAPSGTYITSAGMGYIKC